MLIFQMEFSVHRNHTLTSGTLHTSFISWLTVVHSKLTIATATAEQRCLTSTAVHIVNVIGSTATAKVGIGVGNSTYKYFNIQVCTDALKYGKLSHCSNIWQELYYSTCIIR